MDNKYESLLEEINVMLTEREKGYNVAQQLNDEFWEELGTHKKRVEEQIRMSEGRQIDSKLNAEMQQNDSIYEAARSYIAKYK